MLPIIEKTHAGFKIGISVGKSNFSEIQIKVGLDYNRMKTEVYAMLVKREHGLIIIWVSNDEKDTAETKEFISSLTEEAKHRKEKPVIFYSGTRALAKCTGALLKNQIAEDSFR